MSRSLFNRGWFWAGMFAAAALAGFFSLLGLAIADRGNPILESSASVAPWASGMAAIVLAAFTALYVAATQAMARATADLAEETRKAREESAAPLVTTYFEFQRRLLFITIENIGGGIARNVRVTFQPPIPSHEYWIKELPVTTHNIPTLRPHEKFSHFVDVAPTFFARRGKPTIYTATVTCDNIDGQPREALTYPLNISVYEKMLVVEEDERMAELVKHVERITRILESITDFSSLKIKTPRDIHREHEEWLRRVEEEQAQQQESGPVDEGSPD